jgi:Domain of unknown function (DUF1844)
MSSDSPEEPKLIIDEDWKTQVQREKERLKQQKEQEPVFENANANQPVEVSGAPSEPAMKESLAATSKSDNETAEKELQPPPPASFEFLVSGMATQAIAAMGHLPGDEGQSLPVRLDYARHYIDLLGIIESKTVGNLSDAEQRFLQNTLHQLRMLFVQVKK